jgi:hypothetical protein
MALERTFVEKRSIGVHYMAVKKSWEKLVFDQSQSVCLVELLLQQVLQHFWYTGKWQPRCKRMHRPKSG